MPKRRIRVKMGDGDKGYGEIGRKERNLLVSNVSHRSWSQREHGAAMKKLELQHSAGQMIQIMHVGNWKMIVRNMQNIFISKL